MKRLLAFLPFIFFFHNTKAQVSISPGQTVMQNFDSMATSATAELPAGWKADIQDAERKRYIYTLAGNSTTQTGSVNIATNATAGIYNFGATSNNSDRCIGGLTNGTNTKTVNVYVDLVNNGTTDISGFIISFDVEKYKRGTGRAGYTMEMQYSSTGNSWRYPLNGAFRASFSPDATNEGYDSVPGATQSIISQILWERVPPGSHLYLAWSCSVSSGDGTPNAQALGVDNIVITAMGDASAPLLSPSALKPFGSVCPGTTTYNSFLLKGTNLDNTPITIGPLSNYAFSTSIENFTDKLVLSGSNLNTTIYVKFTPTEIKSYNGNIPITGGGATSISIPATGAGANIPPTVSTGSTSTISSSGATLAGSITDNGCSSVTSYGIEYSTNSNFANATKTTSSNLTNGTFSSNISSLSANTIYYYRAYATNSGGKSYGDQKSFTTPAEALPPTLTGGTLNGFGNVCVGANSFSNSLTLTGMNLNGTNIIIGPLAGYSFSTSANGTYSPQLLISYVGSSFNTVVYVRFSPIISQSYNGNIPINGGGSASINVATTGSGINTAPASSTGTAGPITETTSILNGNITDIGCSPITAYGIEYSTVNGFANSTGTAVASSNLSGGAFSSAISNLSPSTTYYYHSYATNGGGTSYGSQKSFTTNTATTLPLNVVAIAATDTATTSFTANWHPATGAVKYYLDVSTTNDFIDNPVVITLANWTFPDTSADATVDAASTSNTTKNISAKGGTKDPTFDATTSSANSKAAKATGWNDGANVKYWQIEINTLGYQNILLSSKQRSSGTGPKDFKIQYKIGAMGTWTDVPTATVTVADNFTAGVLTNKSLPTECNNQNTILLRWIMTSNIAINGDEVGPAGVSSIDDILITGTQTSYVAGYKNRTVTDTSLTVTGLSPNTIYYYRVRATDGNTVSENSNVITVTTLKGEESALPTSLLSFSGLGEQSKNVVQWVTATENNNQGFTLYRSSDSVHFQPINFTASSATGGNSTTPLEYTFNDYALTGNSQFYRLEVVNLDGSSYFSDTISVKSEIKNELIRLDGLYPNPASGSINLKITSPVQISATCSIIDSKGRILKQIPLQLQAGSTISTININNLSSGIYYLKCSFQEFADVRKFIVQ